MTDSKKDQITSAMNDMTYGTMPQMYLEYASSHLVRWGNMNHVGLNRPETIYLKADKHLAPEYYNGDAHRVIPVVLIREPTTASNGYVLLQDGDDTRFREHIRRLSAYASLDATRFFVMYEASEVTASLGACTEKDGENAVCRLLTKTMDNPFQIHRLDGIQHSLEELVCELTRDGELLGSDAPSFAQKGLATIVPHSLFVPTPYGNTVLNTEYANILLPQLQELQNKIAKDGLPENLPKIDLAGMHRKLTEIIGGKE